MHIYLLTFLKDFINPDLFSQMLFCKRNFFLFFSPYVDFKNFRLFLANPCKIWLSMAKQPEVIKSSSIRKCLILLLLGKKHSPLQFRGKLISQQRTRTTQSIRRMLEKNSSSNFERWALNDCNRATDLLVFCH